MSSALAKAAQAEDVKKLPAGTQVKALEEALSKVDKLKAAAASMKGNVGHTAMQGVHFAETQGTLFLASMGSGYAQSRGKKLKIGPVPLRLATGVLVGAWGMYDALTGGGGTHQMAVASGLIGSETAELGLKAGQALSEKMAEKKATDPAALAPGGAPAQIPSAAPDLTVVEAKAETSGPIREVHAEPARRELKLLR